MKHSRTSTFGRYDLDLGKKNLMVSDLVHKKMKALCAELEISLAFAVDRIMRKVLTSPGSVEEFIKEDITQFHTVTQPPETEEPEPQTDPS